MFQPRNRSLILEAHCRAVLEIDKEHPGIRSRRRPRRCGLLRAGLDMRIQSYCREIMKQARKKKRYISSSAITLTMGLQGAKLPVAADRSEVCEPIHDSLPLCCEWLAGQILTPLIIAGSCVETGLTSE